MPSACNNALPMPIKQIDAVHATSKNQMPQQLFTQGYKSEDTWNSGSPVIQ